MAKKNVKTVLRTALKFEVRNDGVLKDLLPIVFGKLNEMHIGYDDKVYPNVIYVLVGTLTGEGLHNLEKALEPKFYGKYRKVIVSMDIIYPYTRIGFFTEDLVECKEVQGGW